MTAKKGKKRESHNFCSWQKKRESPNIFGCDNNKYENIWMKVLAHYNEYGKRNYKQFFLLKTTYTRGREEKSEELVAISSWVVLILSPSTLHLVTIILQQCQDICLRALP